MTAYCAGSTFSVSAARSRPSATTTRPVVGSSYRRYYESQTFSPTPRTAKYPETLESLNFPHRTRRTPPPRARDPARRTRSDRAGVDSTARRRRLASTSNSNIRTRAARTRTRRRANTARRGRSVEEAPRTGRRRIRARTARRRRQRARG